MTMREKMALQTRENIIEAAKKVITKKGFKEASIQDITEEAGVAKGTFYTYFNSKEEIIKELVSTKFITFENGFLDKSLEEKIRSFNINLMEQIQSCDVEICRQWIINNLKPVELDKIGYDSESVRRILQSSIKNGELRKDTPIEELVGFIISTIYGMMLSWCMTDKSYEPKEHLESVTKFILNSIKIYKKGEK